MMSFSPPMRTRGTTLCLALLVATGHVCLYAAQPTGLARIEKDIQATYDSVRTAVVKIEIPNGARGNGVIVTPDGHILTTASSAQDYRDSRIEIHLADGRRMTAVPLGWSGEWNIGLLKIASDAPFPHVPLRDPSKCPKAGQECVAIGYPAQPHLGNEPVVRFGRAALVCDPIWCTCTCPLWFDHGTGLFDLQGQLLGICTLVPASTDPVFTLVAPVRDNWKELVSGKNIDEVRLFGNEAPAGPASARNTSPANDLTRASAATVRILPKSGQNWSGVIVTEDGYIATCAHHKHLPGEKVTVSLADGREVPARVLGMNRVTDIGLVKIVADGPWPFSDMGDSRVMKVDTSATAMGFPGSYKDRNPLIRPTHIVATPRHKSVVPSLWLHTNPKTSQLRGGDSGGGLFDPGGKLIGIHQGVDPHNSHIRVESLRRQWDFLVAAKAVREQETHSRDGLEAAFATAANDKVKAAVVEVLCEDRAACIGFIVSSDGNIVTKYSELKGQVSCRLHSGAKLRARVVRYSREDDLALLKVDATGLPEIGWSTIDPRLRTFIAAIIPGKSPIVGLVTQPARPIPAEEGMQWPLRDTEEGLAFFDVPRESERPFEKNDIIVSVGGHATPSFKTFCQVMQPTPTTRLAYPGDNVQVTVMRGKKALDLRCVIPSLPSDSLQRESSRRSGFAKALDSEMTLLPTQAGAPAIDGKGDVAGIVIACRGRGQTHILPTPVVRRFLSEP